MLRNENRALGPGNVVGLFPSDHSPHSFFTDKIAVDSASPPPEEEAFQLLVGSLCTPLCRRHGVLGDLFPPPRNRSFPLF